MRAARGTHDIRCQLAWHWELPGRVRSASRCRFTGAGRRRKRNEGRDLRLRSPKQNNSPTPLLGTAMISYFWRGAVFFFPLKQYRRANAHRTRPSHSRGAGAAFLTAARASHHPSDVGGNPARWRLRTCVSCVRCPPNNENTLRDREDSANLRALRERSPPFSTD